MGCLLPTNLMDFRVQIYVTKGIWAYMEQYRNMESWTDIMILGLVHYMLVFWNMHNFVGGDVLIICINWDKELVDVAVDYWVKLSADNWMKEEHDAKCVLCIVCQVYAKVHGHNPCFYQVNPYVCALLLDEEVSYILSFIVILETRKDGKDHVFFTHPSHCPLPSILNTLPKTCRSASCTNSKCIGVWRIEDCCSLHCTGLMV
ncbi:uncharacterized protein EV420DRAFT_1695586 [Desarmillaria tabescens]|uniref:Uncharacterized protein n=1 Tax=Armillaria tabescens TaxID=1929756 RepID=A0AA39K4G7_ARMTA|nr:uncharacterized protein EV420DRAFT_1695586 [Desarmillaria tabescens]KAK0454178.1 hypothetical protein EV420DRAFT_1695586 [Desarmillaria tabescens]